MSAKLKQGDIVEYVGDSTPILKGSFGVVVVRGKPRGRQQWEEVDIEWIVVVPSEERKKWVYAKNLRKVGEMCE